MGTGNPNLKELFHFNHSISLELPSRNVKNDQNRYFFTQNRPKTLSRGFLGTGNPNLKELFLFDHSISEERPRRDAKIIKIGKNRYFFTQNCPKTLTRGFLGTGNPNLKELFHSDHSIFLERPCRDAKNYQNR